MPNTGKGSNSIPLEQHKYVPTKEVIREILELANIRTKAIILCGCSAGLSVNEIMNLKVGQFKNGYDHDTGITTLHIRRQKVQYDYITFLSPEASKAVERYVEWRNQDHHIPRGPRRPHTDVGRKIYSDDDYLFVSDYSNKKFLETRDEETRKLDTTAIISSYRRLNGDAGHKRGKWRDIRSHNMRKYFNTTLLNAGADIFFVDFLMGHKISGTHEAYYRADPESLKKKYIKYLPFLAIAATEVHTIESAEYRMLREQNADLEAKVAKMETPIDDGIAKAVDAALAERMKKSESL